jgi:hypothetical protein
MSSYTADQYSEQRRITQRINLANAAGLCVECNVRPQATWRNGSRRVTCGADACYRKWLRVRPEIPAPAGERDDR